VKKKKLKSVKVFLIPRLDDKGKVRQPYAIMEWLVGQHHAHLAEAKIALAWKHGNKSDQDGRLQLGQCRKASDLDHELHRFDFVILLNYEAWNMADWTVAQMEALIDHELTHASVAVDEDGEEKRNSQGRIVWRIRKHDVEEFREIVERHGLWKGDLSAFAMTAIEAGKNPMFGTGRGHTVGPLKFPLPNNLESVTISSGGKSVTIDHKGVVGG